MTGDEMAVLYQGSEEEFLNWLRHYLRKVGCNFEADLLGLMVSGVEQWRIAHYNHGGIMIWFRLETDAERDGTLVTPIEPFTHVEDEEKARQLIAKATQHIEGVMAGLSQRAKKRRRADVIDEAVFEVLGEMLAKREDVSNAAIAERLADMGIYGRDGLAYRDADISRSKGRLRRRGLLKR